MTEKPKTFYQRLVEAAKERLKKFKFADPVQADSAAMAVVKHEAALLRHEHIRGSMIRNRIARQRTKKRMERRSRQINYAKARA